MAFSKIEKEWTTKSGLEAVAVMTTLGTRNGYIKYHFESPLEYYQYSINIDEIDKWTPTLVAKQRKINAIEVHGGITYSDFHKEIGSDLVGFDCNHVWDLPDWETADKLFGDDPDYHENLKSRKGSYQPSDAHIRSLDYVIEQCELLADQLKEL